MAESKSRFVSLDGLRGVAAIAVAIGHLYGTFPGITLAVDFFFMLSGFVLVHAFDHRLKCGMGLKRFMLQRAIRLFPMIVLGTVLGATTGSDYTGLLGAMLIPIPGPRMYPLDPPAWSLLFEMIGSAMIGIRLWQRGMPLALALLACGGIALIVGVIHRGSFSAGWALESFHYGMARVVFGFSAGAILYRLRLEWAAPRWMPGALLILLLLMPIATPAYELPVALIAFPIILVTSSNAPPFPAAKILGDLSYPIYIMHWPMFLLLTSLPPVPRLLCVGASALMAVRLYDEPVRRWLTNLTVGWQTVRVDF